MKITPTWLAELAVVEPRVFEDERGWFMESYNEPVFDAALAQAGLAPAGRFVQDNHSASRQGVLRGLHYQLPPFAQGKLVRVTHGVVWDVAVDVRKSSATFGQWLGIELSAANRKQLWIPPGFAHGFVTLSETAEFLYKTTAVYDKASERAIVWNDPHLAIDWPLPQGVQALLAAKDAQAPVWAQADFFD
ncbi:MAG: dTDP-4-dehydrorhamnose 3,5-epimerase [Burkholderiaceae bacterium]|nr:dTDP-4-dehydrorhamnose 3,5-epimerase [Burkholderiaceae bacterium]